ncbi:MAG: aminotransferase class I/II-fold pyridoxal phosphate-dependent enzyme [Gammaproteobacteria bacterium]|nr:aminotransferase class I/II-fold pyridoxal phosphate-dependent enzyme [Gammaproteobacteria bacterium]
MALKKIEPIMTNKLAELAAKGTLKGAEKVITGVKAACDGFSERYTLKGYGDRGFLRMNSNSYLGLALNREVIEAESRAAERFGSGPGAVRFISGTYQSHIELEQKLAAFHGRESALIMSAAYATVMGVLPQFINEDTLIISDALNHNCIINAIRLSRPARKAVYPHLDMTELDKILETGKGQIRRACVVTDGIFSMRGDYAPLDEIVAICKRHEDAYAEGIISIVDDSHGVGAFGKTGRGTEEVTRAQADILIATLGKALGVNGGYVVSSAQVISYLRETAPFYIYSNPITPAEAAATITSLEILDSAEGLKLLEQMRNLAARLRAGLSDLGFETIESEHPIVPILTQDTHRTSALVQHLFENNILVTGLNYPVVPKGEEEIRLQVSANHTENDMDYLLETLKRFLDR